MKNSLLQMDIIEGLLKPETAIESVIIQNPEFKKGLFWGTPRYGHPEGKIIYHIVEVLKNIDLLNINPQTRLQLRQVAFIHDTFKHLEDQNRPRDWSKHHSMIARQFAEKYISDETVLSIIEHHDEAFYSWRSKFIFGREEKGELRMQRLINNVADHMQTFYLFFKCDTKTGDKTQKPLHWFESTVPNIQLVTL